MNAFSHRDSENVLQATEVGVAREVDRQSAHGRSSGDRTRADDPLTELTSQLSELDLRSIALLLAHNMAGGTAAAENSYRLIQAYAWDDEVRAGIDSIAEEYHRRNEVSRGEA